MLKPDQSRVLLRPFVPGNWANRGIVGRVMSIPDSQVLGMLDDIDAEFSGAIATSAMSFSSASRTFARR